MPHKALVAVIVAFMLHVQPVKADECITVDEFSSAFASEGVRLRGSTAAATEKMAALFNSNRAARGQPSVEVSIFLFGLVTTKSGDTGALVAVFDKSGCVVPKSIAILSLRVWSEFAMLSGVGPEDFVPLEGA